MSDVMTGKQTHEELLEFLSPIEDVIEDARNGRMFILVDDEDRENEGDLIIPAQMATPDAINFMAKYGRGLICLSMTGKRIKELGIPLMASNNQERHQTAFTVSIEAREGVTTGISAHDRARTIAVAIDPTKGARDIVTPGHVFPLMARDGGVLVLETLAGQFPFLRKLFADGGYQGPKFRQALAKILPQLKTEIVKRSDKARGFEVLPRRWVVERTLAWLNRCRRLARDWENLTRNALAFLRLASIRLMLRKLSKTS